jgi:hypothetical protein
VKAGLTALLLVTWTATVLAIVPGGVRTFTCVGLM